MGFCFYVFSPPLPLFWWLPRVEGVAPGQLTPEHQHWWLLPLFPTGGGHAEENKQGAVESRVGFIVRGVNLIGKVQERNIH